MANESNKDLLSCIFAIEIESFNRKRQTIESWTQVNRKYPDGLKFPYKGEQAEITGAFILRKQSKFMQEAKYFPLLKRSRILGTDSNRQGVLELRMLSIPLAITGFALSIQMCGAM